MITLSRLKIIGTINEFTPECVINEIAECYRLDPKDPLIKLKIETYAPPSINIPTKDSSKEDLKKLAYFINPQGKFTKTNLLECYDFLSTYMNNSSDEQTSGNLVNSVPIPSGDLIIGNQTNENVYSLNYCVLYKICAYYGLPFNRKTTSFDMLKMIQLLLVPKPALLNELQININPNLSRSSIINCLIALDRPLPEPSMITITNQTYNNISEEEDKYNLNETHSDEHRALMKRKFDIIIRDSQYLKLLTLTSHYDAVVLSAFHFDVNISESVSPLDEWKSLMKYKGDKNRIWVDERIENLRRVNPNIYSLKYYFYPDIPIELYKEENLRNIYREYTDSKEAQYKDKQTLYNLLMESSVLNNFWLGFLNSHIENNDTLEVSGDNIIETDYRELISFGTFQVTGMKSSIFKIITFKELYETFSSYMSFRSPFRNETYTKEQMRKLKNILRITKKKDFLGLIERIEKLDDELKESFAPIIEYCNQSIENKTQVIDILKCLLNISMFMRGWDGITEDLPIGLSVHPPELHSYIEERTTNEIQKFEDLTNSETLIGKYIRDLPLLTWDSNQNKFMILKQPEKGLTIYGRINIVKLGDDLNQECCIRLSSNYLASSANMYLSCIDREPFNIYDLRFIS